MRKFYSDYVRHCTKFYFRSENTPSPLTSRVDYNNYASVSNVLAKYDKEVICMLRSVYTAEAVPRAVDEYAKLRKKKSEEVWYLIQKYEREVATERGLL